MKNTEDSSTVAPNHETKFKEVIKNSIDIVNFIGRDVNLHKKNFDDYRGTVGKAGKTGESLVVTPSNQTWHDTKNGHGGDVFSWIAYREGLDERNDFPVILRIAADFAGLEVEGITDADRALIEEGKDVTATLNEVTEIYHQNLLNNPEAIKQVETDWNFGLDEITEFKLGYATGEDLKHIENSRLVKAGLKYKNSTKKHFTHRIIFPYIIGHNTVNFIGKRTPLTPLEKDGKEAGKYKKLLTHDKNPDVSIHVNNKYLYGEDTIKKSDYVLIAEGISDAVSAISNGYPTISAVTTHIKKAEIDRISKVIGKRSVYICLDVDDGGMAGARDMAEALTLRGNEVYIVTLNDSEGKKDYDLNDYFRTHTKEDFNELINGAVGYWNYILNAEIPSAFKEYSILSKLNKLQKFISINLQDMPEELWRAFVEHDVLNALGLTKKEAKATIDKCERIRGTQKEDEEEDSTEETESTKRDSDKFPQWAIDEAERVLNSGEAFSFIKSVWQKKHVGDTNIGENCLCSVATSRILNSKRGLHIKPSGDSGKGKSDAIEGFLELLPDGSYITGSISAKALFYDKDLKPGTLIYSDDASFNPDVVSTIKQSTSKFQNPTVHRTVVNGESQNFIIPERVTFWFSAVEGMDDEQLANRFLHADVDSSSEQDEKVFNHQVESEAWYESDTVEPDVLICRCIFSILFSQFYRVKIPYVEAIIWNNKENRRNFDKFKDVIRAVTVYNYRNREVIDGFLISTPEDYEEALKIYKGTSVNNATNLTNTEIKYLRFIVTRPEKSTTLKELVNHFKVSETAVRKMLNGKNGDGGLLAKIKQLIVIDGSKTVKGDSVTTTTREKKYQYTGEFTGLDMYESISFLNMAEVERVTSEFMSRLHENKLRVTQGNPEGNLSRVTLKNDSSIDNNIINNTRVTQNIEEREDSNSVCTRVDGQTSPEEETHAKTQVTLPREKEGYPHSETVQPNTKTRVTPARLPQVREGYPQQENDIEVHESEGYPSAGGVLSANLLRRAVVKLAKEEYNCTVPDLRVFVNDFIERSPEYCEAYGRDGITHNAEKLKMRGWRL